jgi:hypothetical protein
VGLHTEKPTASLYLNPILLVVACIEIKESLNIDGNKIHQYQQIEHSPLTSNHCIEYIKKPTTYDIGNVYPGPGCG